MYRSKTLWSHEAKKGDGLRDLAAFSLVVVSRYKGEVAQEAYLEGQVDRLLNA